jgi:hypothetical protein
VDAARSHPTHLWRCCGAYPLHGLDDEGRLGSQHTVHNSPQAHSCPHSGALLIIIQLIVLVQVQLVRGHHGSDGSDGVRSSCRLNNSKTRGERRKMARECSGSGRARIAHWPPVDAAALKFMYHFSAMVLETEKHTGEGHGQEEFPRPLHITMPPKAKKRSCSGAHRARQRLAAPPTHLWGCLRAAWEPLASTHCAALHCLSHWLASLPAAPPL